jgi:ABC-type polysaccharide/polyol phosphate transport system ATPase subunit
LRTASDEPAIRFEHVSKRYRRQEGRTLKEFVPAFVRGRGWAPEFHALRDVSFSLGHGETLGIIGLNGSGKTTILRLIAGATAPSSGEVWVSGRVSPLLELGTGFHPDLTGGENVFLNASILGMTNREIRNRFDHIVSFAGLEDFMHTPVKRYSSGMFLRLAFSIAIHSDPDILLLDEALAVGDLPFQRKCFERMLAFQRKGVTIVFVSHALEPVRGFCHRVLLLEAGRVVSEGRADEVVEEYCSAVDRPAGAGRTA